MDKSPMPLLDDGTLRFLPNRLNNQPVIIGGLTADEMWLTLSVSIGTGLVLGLPLAFIVNPAMPIVMALVFGGIGLGLAARILRRWKRGRPETWLPRQIQWWLTLRGWKSSKLIIRSGSWTCKRVDA